VVVAPFQDAVGRDAIIQWPGGVNTQLYVHTSPPTYAPLRTVPENRVYVSPDRVTAFVRSFLAFSHGRVVSDNPHARAIEIGQPADAANANTTYHRIRIRSDFGNVTVLATNGQLPYPYARETTGYAVFNLPDTLRRAVAAGAKVLVAPYQSDGRIAAMVQFPGGYIAELHDSYEERHSMNEA
jgi:hypothetical protein